MSAHAVLEHWILPDRRAELRNGAAPRSAEEAMFQTVYRTHLEDRRAADDRRH